MLAYLKKKLFIYYFNASFYSCLKYYLKLKYLYTYSRIKLVSMNVIDSEIKAKQCLRLFEGCNDFKSLFSMYRRLIISLELPSFSNKIDLNFKELDFNANCLLLNY